jgi:hypothetical protein
MGKKKVESKFFKPAKAQNAYLKAGILGFAGSGKTYTASLIAMGLHKYIGSKKPVTFMDTETGSDYRIKDFEKNKIELLVSKSRSFAEMLNLIDEAEQISDIMIIDSISAVWFDFMESFKKKKGRRFIQFQDWGILKPTWRLEFTDPRYLNSKLHIIICGRAGYEYEYDKDEEGRKELHKTGTKMKAETEFGYEPSLLLEMEAVKEENPNGKGKNIKHYCTVLKDRADILDGRVFIDPSFEDLRPAIDALNLGGEQMGINLEKDSQEVFDEDGHSDWSREQKERTIYLDKIKEEISTTIPGQSANDKKRKKELIDKVFGTKSWVELTEREKQYTSEVLKKGYEEIKKEFEEKVELPFNEDGTEKK